MLHQSTSIVTALILVGFASPPTYAQVAHAQTPDPVVTFLVGPPRDSNALQEAVVSTSVVTVTGDFAGANGEVSSVGQPSGLWLKTGKIWR